MRHLLRALVFLGSFVASAAAATEIEAQPQPQVNLKDAGRHEVVLYPGFLDLTSTFTREAGSALAYQWHVTEGLALRVSGSWGWGSFNAVPAEAIPRTEETYLPPSRVLWSGLAGVEVTPVNAAMTLNGSPAVFEVLINAEAGVVETRHAATYGVLYAEQWSEAMLGPKWLDTGLHPAGSIGLGTRVKLGERLSLRLEVRDLVASHDASTVSGCNARDAREMFDATRVGATNPPAGLSSGCEVSEVFIGQGGPASAYSVLSAPKEGLRHTVSVSLGAGFTF